MVPELCSRLQPQQNMDPSKNSSFFSVPQAQEQEAEDSEDVGEGEAQQGVAIGNSRGSKTGTILAAARKGPMPEDQAGMPAYMQAITVEPAGLYTSEASVARFLAASETHEGANGQQVAKMKQLKASSRDAESGAFSLLYPCGDKNKPFDMCEYLEGKQPGSSAEDDTNVKNLKKMTLAECSKRRN